MRKSVFILIPVCLQILIASTGVQAQDFLVTLTGDTIFGELKPLTYGYKKKVIIVNNEREKTTFSIFNIRCFRYNNETYVPQKGTNGYAFMKVIRSGYLSLYAFQKENQVLYDGQYLAKKDGSGMEVPNLGFKKHVSRFLEDCPQVSEAVAEGTYTRKDIEEIVEAYNACIDERTQKHYAREVRVQTVLQKLEAWDALEEKVKAAENFEGKDAALEMIAEVKNKINRNESIPNFIISGLRSALEPSGLIEAFEATLASSGK